MSDHDVLELSLKPETALEVYRALAVADLWVRRDALNLKSISDVVLAIDEAVDNSTIRAIRIDFPLRAIRGE